LLVVEGGGVADPGRRGALVAQGAEPFDAARPGAGPALTLGDNEAEASLVGPGDAPALAVRQGRVAAAAPGAVAPTFGRERGLAVPGRAEIDRPEQRRG